MRTQEAEGTQGIHDPGESGKFSSLSSGQYCEQTSTNVWLNKDENNDDDDDCSGCGSDEDDVVDDDDNNLLLLQTKL